MTNPIQFGANPQLAPSRNTTPDLEIRFEQNSRSSYSYSESTVVRLQSGEPARPITETSAVDSLGPEQAANNILQFIAQRLASLKAGGADNDVLRAALADAREGFASGAKQAVEILRAGGALDEAQEQRLARIEQRFSDGLERITSNLFGDSEIDSGVEALTREQVAAALTTGDNEAAVTTAGAVVTDATAAPAKVAVLLRASESYRINQKSTQAVSSKSSRTDNQIQNGSERLRGGDNFASNFIESYQSTRASFKRRESVDLQLRTQDGDLVKLSFNAKQSGKFRYDAAQDIDSPGNFASSRAFARLFGSSELTISVVGAIDDDEFVALQQLFDQLGELFSTFFSGDNAGALEQALSLNINSSEIAQFSVDLQLKEEQKLVRKYREIADFGIERGDNTEDSRGDDKTPPVLAEYLEKIRDVAVAKNKTADKTLLEQLLAITFAGGEIAVEDADNSSDQDA
ncbi:MAG: DUF5610 domain-containing protein [Pseudomonadales bacterium]